MFNKFDQNILQPDTEQSILQFQNPQSQQDNITHNQQQDTTLQNLQDSSDIVTKANVSGLYDMSTNNPQSITITNDSNLLQVPVRQVIQNTNEDLTENTNEDLTQNTASSISTSNTIITCPLRTKQISPRNYDPPPHPSQYSVYTNPHNSRRQGSSNPNATTIFQNQPQVQCQTTTLTRQPILQTLSYTPAQNTQTHKIPPGFSINTLHSNPRATFITSRIFLDLNYKSFLRAHYRIVLQAQAPMIHNTLH